jgi:hypothetical protein
MRRPLGHTGASPGYSADGLNNKDGSRQIVVLVNATGPLSAAGFFGPPHAPGTRSTG